MKDTADRIILDVIDIQYPFKDTILKIDCLGLRLLRGRCIILQRSASQGRLPVLKRRTQYAFTVILVFYSNLIVVATSYLFTSQYIFN